MRKVVQLRLWGDGLDFNIDRTCSDQLFICYKCLTDVKPVSDFQKLLRSAD